MPFDGLPAGVQVAIEDLLRENRVVSWRIIAESGSTVIVLRFKESSVPSVGENGDDEARPTPVLNRVQDLEATLDSLLVKNRVINWGITSDGSGTVTVVIRLASGDGANAEGRPLSSRASFQYLQVQAQQPRVRGAQSVRTNAQLNSTRRIRHRGSRNANTDSTSQSVPRSRRESMDQGGSGEGVPSTSAAQESCILKDENNFIQNVSQFFNQEDISDVVLRVGEKRFFGHKFVLAKSSEVFRTMLYDKRWQQAGLPQIDLEESDECQHHFESFLKFLYTAEVQISTDSAVGILCLADKYCVMSLKNLCTRYMVKNTMSPKVRNALNWYSWAKALHMDELIDSCTKTISWNMEALFALPEWLQMDIDFVMDVLSNPQLVVSSEYLLYSAVERWLLHDKHLAGLSHNSLKLLPLVRFPQMMVQQLYKVETGALATKEGSKNLIEKLLNRAYRFRSLCPFQADLNISFNEEFYKPRNYKDLTVDTVRMQNTLRFGIQVDVRTYVGPVPSTVREGEWKITYRKSNDSWTLQLYCHDSAMVNGEARIQAVLVISDDDDRVLQVEASEETVCSRGNHLTMVITLPSNSDAKVMTVLIKPLPN